MVFSSIAFLCVFLPAVFLLSLVLPGIRAKNIMLTIASLLFYAFGEPVYVLVMLASVLANYVLGRLVAGRKRLWVAVAVVVNLGILGVFKYAGMAVHSLNVFAHLSIPEPQIALPIGISFFTFQALSYVIDVYRGNVDPERSLLNVALYISFFPQLIAGPIVKYRDIAQQIGERHVTPDRVASGLRRFCYGLGKKVLIANTMAVAVDALFVNDPANLNVIAAWVAAIAYMLQIYFDFSGYSDMAIGLGRMFGFDFKENFNHPYDAVTVQDFWRKWHISLSTWFKEYLYIPLGGNRKGRARTSLNKFIVFFTCGLWHGAAWTFVAWGILHGLFLMFESYVPMKKLPRAIGHVYTLLVVCIAFVIFRADSLHMAMGIISQMFLGWQFDNAHMIVAFSQLNPLFLVTLVAGAVAAQPVVPALQNLVATKSPRVQQVVEVATYVGAVVVLAFCLMSLASGSYNPFIYFRF